MYLDGRLCSQCTRLMILMIDWLLKLNFLKGYPRTICFINRNMDTVIVPWSSKLTETIEWFTCCVCWNAVKAVKWFRKKQNASSYFKELSTNAAIVVAALRLQPGNASPQSRTRALLWLAEEANLSRISLGARTSWKKYEKFKGNWFTIIKTELSNKVSTFESVREINWQKHNKWVV